MKKLFFLFAFAIMAFANAQRPIITKWNAFDGIIKFNIVGTAGYTFQNISDSSISGNGNLASGINTITLPSKGIYLISISPNSTFKFAFANNALTSNDRAKFSELLQWGDIKWFSDLSNMFAGCANLTISAIDVPDFTNVSTFSGMFGGCSSISSIPKISSWNTKSVTDMSNMFAQASNFNDNLSGWDTSKVLTMSAMFIDASKFNSPIGNWNVSNVRDMSLMFTRALNFNQPLFSWDTSKVTNMRYMFTNAEEFNQYIDTWNVSKVINMWYMFSNAKKFNSPLEDWNVISVQEMDNMFSNASSFNQPLNRWDVSSVVTFRSMFNNASNFNQNVKDWKLNPKASLDYMLNNSAISCNNYTQTLYFWSKNNINNGHGLGATNLVYGPSGKLYRDLLIKNGWTFTGDLYDDSCTSEILGVNESVASKFNIYPNPVKDILNIQTADKIIKVEVYNLSGQLAKAFNSNGGNLAALAKGVYLVKVTTDKGTVTKKIIKE